MQGRSAAVAVAAVLSCCAAVPAAAMSDRDRQTIELLDLDTVPRGSRRPEERGTYVYGQLDLGLLRPQRPDERDPCGRPRETTADELSGSRLGLAGRETLDGGYEAYARIEMSPLHTAPPACTLPFWNRAAQVGWGRRDLGWLEAGRVHQPAHGVAVGADPWEGDSVAAGVDMLLYGAPPIPRWMRETTRTDRALTARTPDRLGWQLELQGSVRPDADPHGAAWRAWHGAWQTAIGYQRWERGQWSLPLSASLLLGDWTAFGGLSVGRLDDQPRRAFTVGAREVEPTGPRRRTLRFAFAEVHESPQAPLRRWSAGAEWRLGPRTATHAEFSLQQREGQAARLAFGLGLRHRFELR